MENVMHVTLISQKQNHASTTRNNDNTNSSKTNTTPPPSDHVTETAAILNISRQWCFVGYRNLHRKFHVGRPREMTVTILIITGPISLVSRHMWCAGRGLSRIFGARFVGVHYVAHFVGVPRGGARYGLYRGDARIAFEISSAWHGGWLMLVFGRHLSRSWCDVDGCPWFRGRDHAAWKFTRLGDDSIYLHSCVKCLDMDFNRYQCLHGHVWTSYV